jgi:simple sugar transport system permease protein
VGVALGALVWAAMERSGQMLDLLGVSSEIVVIMQAVIVLAIVVAYELVRRATIRRQARWVGETGGSAGTSAPGASTPGTSAPGTPEAVTP